MGNGNASSKVGRLGLLVGVGIAALVLLLLYWPRPKPDSAGPAEVVETSTEPAQRAPRVAPDTSRGATDTGRRTVEIRVRSDGGRDALESIPGATVQVARVAVEGEDPESDRRESRADGDGDVRLDDALPGTWGVEVTAAGHLGKQMTFRLADGPSDVHVIWEVILDRLPRLTLTIRSPSGATVTGVRTRVIVPHEANLPPHLIHPDDRSRIGEPDRVTGADGVVGWDVLPVGSPFSVFCDHAEVGRKLLRLEPLRPGEHRTVDVQLSPHTTIVGRVAISLPPDGSRTTVECWHLSDSHTMTAEQRVVLDEEGRFRLRAVNPGNKRLIALTRGNGWIEFSTVVLRAEEGVENDAGTLSPGSLTYRLHCQTDETPQPDVPIEVAITVAAANENDASVFSIETRAGRTLEFRGLPDGEIGFHGSVPTDRGLPRYDFPNIRVRPGDTLREGTLVLKRQRPEDFGALRVKFHRAPFAPEGHWRAAVSVLRGDEVLRVGILGGHDVPEIDLARLEPGPCKVIISCWERVIGPFDAELVGGQVTHVMADRWDVGTGLVGRVVDENGAPKGNAVVSLSLGTEPAGFERALFNVRSDDDGRFRIPVVPPVADLSVQTRSAEPVPVDAQTQGEIVLTVRTSE